MQHQFYGLRGKAYSKARKQLRIDLEAPIKQDVEEIKKNNAKFTIKDCGVLAMKYRVPLNILVEDYLVDYKIVSYDTWERFSTSTNPETGKRFRAKDVGVIWE